ncbi:hypothetical protein OHD62_17250 [Mesorhizobium sp. YC-39]|uniref:hypothetical protein n=1 Tax=unclassified Mesorhizobium TaxID=325217 RepID=UPI0021E82F47|nr:MULTISPECIES: hypothetical protein [unclassified Mesorhizobium]MCV3209590.1 hypothetical protein [Mesorhizobium sp. YC-2]MCV3230120.1 hypothetical protein [Mesorhizobium sp. YC-39]
MMAILALTLKNWKLIALGALIAAVPISYTAGRWKGDTQGYNRRVAEVAAADVKAELERKGDNAKLSGMSDYDLCVSGLRGSGMPVDACEQLRGLPEKQP